MMVMLPVASRLNWSGRRGSSVAQHACYSEAFDHLPPTLRERVYRRLYDVLTGADTRDLFALVSPDRRRAALAIVLETKDGLPDYWKPTTAAR